MTMDSRTETLRNQVTIGVFSTSFNKNKDILIHTKTARLLVAGMETLNKTLELKNATPTNVKKKNKKMTSEVGGLLTPT